MFSYKNLLVVCLLIIVAACQPAEKPAEPDQPLFTATPEAVTTGFRFTEGPIWHSDGYLLFSDIPGNTIYKWTPGSDSSEVYLTPSFNSNGIKIHPDGSLIIAQHAGRVSRINEDLSLTILADSYDGKRINSPNDIAIRTDGIIYFTDPDFGVSAEDKELDFSGVYRLNADGSLTVLYNEFSKPNGIVFSPSEDHLYVNDSTTGQIIRFDVDDVGDVSNPTPFASIGERGQLGGADGMVVDASGRLYTTGPNGLIVFNPDGTENTRIVFEHQITNLAWGGADGNDLFITSPNAVYRIPVNL